MSREVVSPSLRDLLKKVKEHPLMSVSAQLGPREYIRTPSPDVLRLEDMSSDEEDFIPFVYQGVEYDKDSKNRVYNSEMEEVGFWTGNSIDFNSSFNAKQHNDRLSKIFKHIGHMEEKDITKGDPLKLHQEGDDDDDDDEKEIIYEGIKYILNTEDEVFDIDTGDKVGNWDGESIIFTTTKKRKAHDQKRRDKVPQEVQDAARKMRETLSRKPRKPLPLITKEDKKYMKDENVKIEYTHYQGVPYRKITDEDGDIAFQTLDRKWNSSMIGGHLLLHPEAAALHRAHPYYDP